MADAAFDVSVSSIYGRRVPNGNNTGLQSPRQASARKALLEFCPQESVLFEERLQPDNADENRCVGVLRGIPNFTRENRTVRASSVPLDKCGQSEHRATFMSSLVAVKGLILLGFFGGPFRARTGDPLIKSWRSDQTTSTYPALSRIKSKGKP